MPRLAKAGHEVAISGPHSFSGAPVAWQQFPVLPAGQDAFGSDVIAGHYAWHQADLMITLCDVFMLDPNPLKALNVACWTPIDCAPHPVCAPPELSGMSIGDANNLRISGAATIAMSRFGQGRLEAAGFEPMYAPHCVDTSVFAPPEDRDQVRAGMGIHDGAFVVGLCAANKDGPRKAFPEQMAAFARFHRRHPEARLVIHSLIEPMAGANLKAIAGSLGIGNAIFFPEQYPMLCGMMGDDSMATWYGALDLLSNCTFGEGFGVPILEAQACGTPVVVTDCSAMSELCGSGWRVSGQEHWVPGHNSWWTCPSIREIDAAYEKAYQATRDGRMAAKREQAREFALRYDADAVFARYWLPILDVLGERRVRKLGAAGRAAVILAPARDDVRDLCVIVPTRGRPGNAGRLIAAVAETATARTDIVFAVDDDDPFLGEYRRIEQECRDGCHQTGPEEPGAAGFRFGPRRSLSAWTNEIAGTMAGRYRALASMGDDHVPQTKGWDTELLTAIEAAGGVGFAYPNDLVRDDIPEAVVVSSEIVTALGWMCEPSLSHYFVDNVWAVLGKQAGCIAYCPDVIVEHVHPGRRDDVAADQTYRENVRRISPDEAAYQQWREQRMAADIATVRTVRAKAKAKVAV